MSRPLHCSLFTLLTATLGLLSACSGTETDNPVAGNGTPVIDGPSNEIVPPSIPGCPPPVPESLANFPSGLARAVLLPATDPQVLATGGDSGLDLLDWSDPGQPIALSSDVVRGTIHQLLLSKSGMLWVAATEPPAVADSGLPDRSALDPELHLVELDVSNPRAPLRVAQATLDGDFWQMQERGDSIWALSARRVASERSCEYVDNSHGCAQPSYEALVLRGFEVDASALTPKAEAELPFDIRAFLRPDGVATSLSDGSLHVLAWDAQGNLRAPIALALGDADHRPGPVEIVGDQLSVIDSSGGHVTLRRYDLDAGIDTATSSADLGPSTNPPSEFSVFDAGRLWLSGNTSAGAAQLWDVSSDAPQRIPLAQSFDTLVPIAGATLATDPSAALAVGWQYASGTEVPNVLAFSGGKVNVVAQLAWDQLQLGAGRSAAAPAGISGSGDSDAWQLVLRGAGLPLGVDPSAPPGPEIPWALVNVPLSVASGSSAPTQIAEARLVHYGAPSLQITNGNTTSSFVVSPGATRLIAMPNAVIVVADESVTGCRQSGLDCSAYAPGIAVYDLSSQPRLAGNLAFPALPAVNPNGNSSLDVTWQFLGGLGDTPDGTPVDPSRLTLVANVELSCNTESDCSALGIAPLPLAQAGVAVGTPAPCPDGASCPAPPPTPTVFGQSQREYFYALSFDAQLQPSWQALGFSAGESSSARLELESRFAGPIAAGDIVAATRLEQLSSSGEALPRGQARFMFDRFALSDSGSGVSYPPVNVIGYPIARFADAGAVQRWLSVDVAPATAAIDSNATAAVHLLSIDEPGAHDTQSLSLPGTFSSAVTLQGGGGAVVPVVLTVPQNSCGTSQLTAFSLDANGVLSSSSPLELPADRWSILAVDGRRVVLQRDQLYALVEADGNALSIVSLRSSDRSASAAQLLGTTLIGSGGNSVRIDF